VEKKGEQLAFAPVSDPEGVKGEKLRFLYRTRKRSDKTGRAPTGKKKKTTKQENQAIGTS